MEEKVKLSKQGVNGTIILKGKGKTCASGGIQPFILNLYLDIAERSASPLAAFPPQKEPAVPTEQSLGGSKSYCRNSGIQKRLLHLQGPSVQ